jgi:hypothetical protein
MPLVCPRCQHTNPTEAVYCHFDGVVLVPSAGGTLPPGILPQEFVFPSGRRCKTFDDLVQGCQYEWEDARVLLKRGDFGPYFARIGRLDLARAAREAQEQPDTDIALHELVAGLPATSVQGPRLDLQPRRILIGPVLAGHEDEVRLTVVNQGKGLLQGKLAISEGGTWLHTGAENNGNQVALKTARTQEVTLRVNTRGLVAPQSYSARLTVVSNGGVVDVPVRLDVAAVPFSRPPFQGALNPRDLAARMRANPKAAVPLLENGEIASWFETNGWTYPVPGAPARGVAAVQQFFEHMGLSKPPPLTLAETSHHFDCEPGETASGKLTIRTAARKWVYAEVASDVPWLRVTTPSVSGAQQAIVSFEINCKALPRGAAHETTLRVTGNAGQALTARVTVKVREARRATPRRRTPRSSSPILSGALVGLFYRLLLSLPVDFWARGAAGGLEHWQHSALSEDGFLRSFVMATWWIGGAAGLVVARRQGGKLPDLFCGAIAGSFAGLAAAATAGCVVGLLDAGPRLVLAQLAAPSLPPVVAELLWVALAATCWGVGGALIGGVLGLCGRAGRTLLDRVAAPITLLVGDKLIR